MYIDGLLHIDGLVQDCSISSALTMKSLGNRSFVSVENDNVTQTTNKA